MTTLGSLRRSLFRSSILALVAKFIGAPASYLMFVALARAMSLEDYGRFAFAFSLVLLLAKLGVAGQSDLLLKLLPAHDGAAQAPVWRAAMRFALRLSMLVSLGAALGMALYGWAAGATYLVAAAALVPCLAFSELQSAVLRTRGKIVAALAPREIVWRLSLVALAGGVLVVSASQLGPTTVFLFAVTSAVIVFALQALSDPATRYWQSLRGPSAPPGRDWWRMSGHFWITSTIVFAAPNLSVVVIGAALSPSQTGPFFAALKTAQLLQLFLMASNIVATPIISRYHSAGDRARVQEVCRTVSASASGFALLSLIAIILFGRPILALFGKDFSGASAELIILSIGFAFSAFNGPNGVLLQMSGHEARFTRIVLISNGIALLALFPAAFLGGSLAAALVVSGAMVVWNLLATRACRRHTGIDPSVRNLLS